MSAAPLPLLGVLALVTPSHLYAPLEAATIEALAAAGDEVASVVQRVARGGQRVLYLVGANRDAGTAVAALSLAVALQSRGAHAVLVDGDPGRAELTRALYGTDAPGLTDYLTTPNMPLGRLLRPICGDWECGAGSLCFLPLGTGLAFTGTWGGGLSGGFPHIESTWDQPLRALRDAGDVVLICGVPLDEDPVALQLAARTDGLVVIAGHAESDGGQSRSRPQMSVPDVPVVGAILNPAAGRTLARRPPPRAEPTQQPAARAPVRVAAVRGLLSGLRPGGTLLNVVLTIVALGFSGMVPFSFNIAVGRFDGPAALGAVSAVLGLALFLGQVPATVGTAVTKFMAEELGRGDETAARSTFQFVFVVNLVLACLFAAGLGLGAPWIGPALHSSQLVLFLGAGLVLMYALYLFFKSVYYGTQRVATYVRNEIVSDVGFFAVLAVVLLLHTSPWLLLPFVLNNLFFTAVALRDLRDYFRAFDAGAKAARGTILRYCAISGGGTAASLGSAVLAPTVAGLYLTHHDVGLYAVATALTTPLQLLPRALALVLFSTMARLHGATQTPSIRALHERSTMWLVLVLGVLVGLVVLNAPTMLRLVGSRYSAATLTTQIVVVGAYLTMICGPSISSLTSTQYVRVPSIGGFIGLAVSLATWFVLIPRLGLLGVPLGFAASALIQGAIPAVYAHRLYQTSATPFVRAILTLVVLGAVQVTFGHRPLLASAVFLLLVATLYIPAVHGVWRSGQLRHVADTP